MPANPGFSWDVLVVDNNSNDSTARRRRVAAPAVSRCRCATCSKARQGKSNALNTGHVRGAGRDHRVHRRRRARWRPDWLEAAVRPLLERTGHRLHRRSGPADLGRRRGRAWLDESGNLGGTIAVKDHGPAPFVFEDERKTPLGVNMAVRRSLIERIGGFRPDLGRNGKALLGQEQAEFFYRSRQAGARGLYVPAMVLDHVVPAARLTRSYFRRWWYWKGVSHARVHGMHGRTELGIDMRRVPRVLGVPRFIFGSMARNALGWLRRADPPRTPRGAPSTGSSLVYYVGYCREIWRPTTLGRETPVQTTGRRSSSESPALS